MQLTADKFPSCSTMRTSPASPTGPRPCTPSPGRNWPRSRSARSPVRRPLRVHLRAVAGPGSGRDRRLGRRHGVRRGEARQPASLRPRDGAAPDGRSAAAGARPLRADFVRPAAVQILRLMTGARIGWVLDRYDEEAGASHEARAGVPVLQPRARAAATEQLWPGPWDWAIYEVRDLETARQLPRSAPSPSKRWPCGGCATRTTRPRPRHESRRVTRTWPGWPGN